MLTTFQLHRAGLDVHGKVLQIHRAGQNESQPTGRCQIQVILGNIRIRTLNSSQDGI